MAKGAHVKSGVEMACACLPEKPAAQSGTFSPTGADSSAQAWERNLQDKDALYCSLTMGSVAYPYRVSVTLIRAMDDQHLTDQLNLGWPFVANEVDRHVPQDDQGTCLTKFLEIVAEYHESLLDKLSVGSESRDDRSFPRG